MKMSIQSKINLWKEVKHKKWIDNLFYDYVEFVNNTNKSDNTKEWEIKNIMYFLIYLEKQNENVISIKIVYKYFEVQNAKYSIRTVYDRKECVKYFLNWLYDNKKISFNGKMVFPKINQPTNSSLTSYYNYQEISQILDSINIKTLNGRRNYAIICLLAYLGIRRDDLRTLKFKHIDWENNLLKFHQNKTDELIILPLPNIVKLSLIDYIKNARPNIKNEYIFIKDDGSLYYVDYLSVLVSRIVKSSGIDIKNRKLSCHIFRHSLATNLLKEHVSIKTISKTLGHASSDTTTKEYIAYDKKILQQISLEVPIWK